MCEGIHICHRVIKVCFLKAAAKTCVWAQSVNLSRWVFGGEPFALLRKEEKPVFKTCRVKLLAAQKGVFT